MAGTKLSEDWRPSADDVDYGLKLGLDVNAIIDAAEDLRCWAIGNSNRQIARKANWSMTFKGWLRREAAKRKPQPKRENLSYNDIARILRESNNGQRADERTSDEAADLFAAGKQSRD